MITVLHDWAEEIYAERLRKPISPTCSRTPCRRPSGRSGDAEKAGRPGPGRRRRRRAKGFFDFLEGVVGFIKKGSIKSSRRSRMDDLPAVPDVHVGRSALTKRYCSEALLAGEAIDVEAVQALVRASGDSAIVAGSPKSSSSTSTRRRGRSLLRAPEARHDPGHQGRRHAPPVRAATSASPDRRPDRFVLRPAAERPRRAPGPRHPLQPLLRDSLFLDKVTIEPDRFYDLLRTRTEMPRSAQPARPGPAALEFLAGHYDAVVAVSSPAR